MLKTLMLVPKITLNGLLARSFSLTKRYTSFKVIQFKIFKRVVTKGEKATTQSTEFSVK